MEDSLKKRLVSLLCDKAHVVDSKWNAKISSYPCKYTTHARTHARTRTTHLHAHTEFTKCSPCYRCFMLYDPLYFDPRVLMLVCCFISEKRNKSVYSHLWIIT